MNKNYGKSNNICITKEELENFITESIQNFLLSDKGKSLISEYAITLSDYKNKIGDRLPIIIIHISLIKYQTSIGKYDYVEHWKGEVFDLIDYIFNQTPKAANTFSCRLKATKSKFDELDLFNVDKIAKIISNKFSKEFDKIDKNIYITICENFVNNIANNLINTIASNDYDVLNDFINSL